MLDETEKALEILNLAASVVERNDADRTLRRHLGECPSPEVSAADRGRHANQAS